MAEFVVELNGHKMWAQTCPTCKGLRYLTAPHSFEKRKIGEDKVHIHRAESGDRCPACIGRGWVGIADGKWRLNPELVDCLGPPDEMSRETKLRSKVWVCSTCRERVVSETPIPNPSPCKRCGEIVFETKNEPT